MKLERDRTAWTQRRKRLIRQRDGVSFRGKRATTAMWLGPLYAGRWLNNLRQVANSTASVVAAITYGWQRRSKRSERCVGINRNESKAAKNRWKKILALRAANIRRMKAKHP